MERIEWHVEYSGQWREGDGMENSQNFWNKLLEQFTEITKIGRGTIWWGSALDMGT